MQLAPRSSETSADLLLYIKLSVYSSKIRQVFGTNCPFKGLTRIERLSNNLTKCKVLVNYGLNTRKDY